MDELRLRASKRGGILPQHDPEPEWAECPRWMKVAAVVGVILYIILEKYT